MEPFPTVPGKVAGFEVLSDDELVERVAWCVPEEWMDRLRRTATHDGGPLPVDDRHHVEVLTVRERDVLRVLE